MHTPVPSLPNCRCQRRPPPCPSSSRHRAFSRAAPLVPARRARARRARPPATALKPPPPAKFGPPAAPVTAPHATPPAKPRLRVAPRAPARPCRPLPPVARRLDSSRPWPISSIRSPRRNPERRLRSVEHHLGSSVLATISGTASALCSPGVPATVAAVLLRHSPLWPATSTTRTLGIPSPWSSLLDNKSWSIFFLQST